MIFPADLVNFARWRQECTNGWTVESTRRLAEKWHVDHSAVRASRDRLADLGWLLVLPRKSRTKDEDQPVWISELYDPDLEMVELDGSSLSYATSRLRPSGAQMSSATGLGIEAIDAAALREYLRAHPASQSVTLSLEHLHQLFSTRPCRRPSGCRLDGGDRRCARGGGHTQLRASSRPSTSSHVRCCCERLAAPAPSFLTELRVARARRRRRALLDLMSPHHPVDFNLVRLRPHDVYLIHFPKEGCFKVGLTHSTSHRINQFSRHGGIVVDRVTVDNKFLAEIIEVDVLALTEDWHRLGDRERPGKGYTEMWSDRGPTVDLERVKLQTTQLVTLIGDLLDGGLW